MQVEVATVEIALFRLPTLEQSYFYKTKNLIPLLNP